MGRNIGTVTHHGLAECSKARVCGRSLAEVPGSNLAGGMDICVASTDKKAKCRKIKTKKEVRMKYREQEN